MIRKILVGLGVIAAIALVGVIWITRDGSMVTPEGTGTVATASGEFEAFPLPDYAREVLPEDVKSYFVEVEPGIKIHVLEVGEGYPVYLQHGNPTNGLLYRKVAAELPVDQMRLIMPTIVGLGFSTKVPSSEHTFDNHLRWMSAALEKLDLENVVYVGQDWGGAIGMGSLMNNPDLIEGAVIMNTGFSAPEEEFELSSAHALAATPIMGELVLENLVAFYDRLKDAQGDPESMRKEVSDLYGRPVLESGNAKGALALMRMVPTGPNHPTTPSMRKVEAYADTLKGIPVELVWGMKDPILAMALPRMREFFPDAPVTETEAGHFLQEEVPVEIAAAIMRVVDEVQAETDGSTPTTGEEQPTTAPAA
ncbi:MAG: alpha/beta fold hydrolase [Pseudomonadota bacterium]